MPGCFLFYLVYNCIIEIELCLPILQDGGVMEKQFIDADRTDKKINLAQFGEINHPIKIGAVDLNPSCKSNVLRMLIRKFPGNLLLPDELKWVLPLIEMADLYQKNICAHPFLYLTIRHNNQKFEKLNEWHVDGFSMKIDHLPEQNYIWCNASPTEYILQKFNIDNDFDPLSHNIHKFLSNRVSSPPKTIGVNEVWMVDPYVLHKAPDVMAENRVFVRASFVPIEIQDANNTQNPLLPQKYTYDGVADFRDQLTDYDAKM